MTLEQDNTIEASLCKLFPTVYLREQAEKSGGIQRDRKVNPEALFWTLVPGFGIGKDRRIASLRRGYMAATGQFLCRSAFYDRFTRALVSFMRQALVMAKEPGSREHFAWWASITRSVTLILFISPIST